MTRQPTLPVRALGAAQHNRSVYVETYGCQMNVADSELVASILNDAGFSITEQAEGADVILLNTCAVREHAEERVIGRVSQLNGLRTQRPHLTLGIPGCMAQHLSDTLSERAPFVDLVMGPDSYRRLPDVLAQSSDDALLDVRLDRSENYVGISPSAEKAPTRGSQLSAGATNSAPSASFPSCGDASEASTPTRLFARSKGLPKKVFAKLHYWAKQSIHTAEMAVILQTCSTE